MKDWFAGAVAGRYDADTAEMPVEPVVDFLLPLAGGGALELAVGTGRIAVPLAERGVRVAGIDLSPDMVAELRKKSEAIPVAIGDYATTRVEGTFSLVFIVFNSINNQTTQDGQVATFANAAAHLDPGGSFVVEVGTPNTRPLEVFDLSDTHVGVDSYVRVLRSKTSRAPVPACRPRPRNGRPGRGALPRSRTSRPGLLGRLVVDRVEDDVDERELPSTRVVA